MKVYARQINPSYQESPLMISDEWPEDLIVTGNRYFNDHTIPEYDQLKNIEEMCGDWQDDGYYYTRIDGTWKYEKHSKKHEYSIKEMLWKWGVSRSDGKPWSNKQKHEWKLLMEAGFDSSEDDDVCEALRLLTGAEWKYTIIRGCSQSDWQYAYYRADRWNEKSLETFETEYFNTGSEWMIHDPTLADGIEEVPESPEDINGFCGYCYSWNEDGIREEIANMAGCNPEDVVMWAWDGTNYSDNYRMVV